MKTQDILLLGGALVAGSYFLGEGLKQGLSNFKPIPDVHIPDWPTIDFPDWPTLQLPNITVEPPKVFTDPIGWGEQTFTSYYDKTKEDTITWINKPDFEKWTLPTVAMAAFPIGGPLIGPITTGANSAFNFATGMFESW